MNEIIKVDVDRVKPNPLQTRKTFDETKLRELGESIKSHGLINPITIQQNGNVYELITGERRLRACKLVGIQTIDAILKDITPEQVSIETYIENVHREDLDYFEKAEAIIHVFKSRGVSNFIGNLNRFTKDKEVLKTCKLIGKSPGAIYNAVKGYYDLEEDERIKYKKLPPKVIQNIGGIKNKKTRKAIVNKIKKEDKSLNESLELIRTVKPLKPEDITPELLNRPVHEIKEESQIILAVRDIPKEELDSQIIKLQENKEVMEKAEKLTKELFGPGKTPETKKSKKAWLDFNNTVAFAESLKDVHCPICGDSKGADNLYWVCHDPPTKAIDTIGIAKERFEKLYKEAMRVKNLN